MIRKIFMFYGWMTIIAAVSMVMYAMFATDISVLGDDNQEGHRQVMLFLSAPMSIGMGILFIMIGRGGSTTIEHKKEEKKEEEKVSRILPD